MKVIVSEKCFCRCPGWLPLEEDGVFCRFGIDGGVDIEKPGPNCPLSDVPERLGEGATGNEVDNYSLRCVAFVERLRKGEKK
jgi:hypothetical protein